MSAAAEAAPAPPAAIDQDTVGFLQSLQSAAQLRCGDASWYLRFSFGSFLSNPIHIHAHGTLSPFVGWKDDVSTALPACPASIVDAIAELAVLLPVAPAPPGWCAVIEIKRTGVVSATAWHPQPSSAAAQAEKARTAARFCPS